jgi:1-acyl-sn-glycerol-3-phosphate acyltransferase
MATQFPTPTPLATPQTKLKTLIDDFSACFIAGAVPQNDVRRKLFSRAELLRIEIEEYAESLGSQTTPEQTKDLSDVYKRLDELEAQIPLLPLKRKSQWWSPFDISLRLSGFIATFVFMGVFASIPVVALKYVDQLFGLDTKHSLAIRLRRYIAGYLLCVCGISQTVIGAEVIESKISSCAILTFGHASNLDGFMLSSSCPIPHYALAKKELFYVPFFSWISLAFGGIPVDRNNRERAIGALERSTQAARDGKMCIVIAPEGTRSATGHLNAFKKGIHPSFGFV